MSDNENGTWTRVGPSGPATSLRGNVLGTDHDRVAGGEGSGERESGEVSGPAGELDEGEREGWWGGG